jgi:hypothetical protein
VQEISKAEETEPKHASDHTGAGTHALSIIVGCTLSGSLAIADIFPSSSAAKLSDGPVFSCTGPPCTGPAGRSPAQAKSIPSAFARMRARARARAHTHTHLDQALGAEPRCAGARCRGNLPDSRIIPSSSTISSSQ